MTNISGKIYQMWDNPTNPTERRFPKTVIEAVYGLSSYLQTQFGNLANIYMPIEGITESKPLQEFVYHLCPSTIKPKSFVLDRIKGKTLAWNQMVTNPNMESTIGYYPIDSESSLSIVSGMLRQTLTSAQTYTQLGKQLNKQLINGHKYYVSFFLKDSKSASRSFYLCTNPYSVVVQKNLGSTSGGMFNFVVDASFSVEQSGPPYISILTYSDSYSAGDYIEYGGLGIIDLTLMFGSGKEPTAAEFEALYPNIFFNPTEGQLISNDAEAIETVGFNLWDEEWEVGAYNNTTGQKSTDTARIRCKNPMPILPDTDYYLKTPSNIIAVVICLDSNGNAISGYSWTGGSQQDSNARYIGSSIFHTPTNGAYLVFYMSSSYGTTYNHDICINLSDPDFNGQYEPYKKSVLGLNLNSIKVYSPNIWDEEWELGTWVNGVKTASSENIRCKNYIPIPSGVGSVYVKGASGKYIFVYCLDSNKNQIGQRKEISGSSSVTIDSGTKYIVFHLGSDYGTTYNHDITINKSDPAFNGRYFPHGILTIEGGLKGAGTVYDEIVGTKLYRRVASIDLGTLTYAYDTNNGVHYIQNFSNYAKGIKLPTNASSYGNAISQYYEMGGDSQWASGKFYISHVNQAGRKAAQNDAPNGLLYYELANVEVYDLAEPLVLTMKAGTTEARVSPNAYGLSAPFCADITYSASENNDSASAQYALTAGRLLNSHKLWGQDFNGEQDITGPLDDVTRINNLLYLVNGNVGIGQSNPQYKLDVAGDGRFVHSGYDVLTLKRSTNAGVAILFANTVGNLGELAVSSSKALTYSPTGSDTYNVYHSGNSNKTTVPWSASSLTLNGSITGADYITASSLISGGGISSRNGYYYMNDSDGITRTLIDRSIDRPIFGYGFGAASYDVYYTGYNVCIYAGTNWNDSSKGITITNSGLVGIGTSIPGRKLDVNGDFQTGNSTYKVVAEAASDCGLISFWKGGFHKGRIEASSLVLNYVSGGVVGIGTNSPNSSYKLDVGGDMFCSGSSTFSGNINSNGDLVIANNKCYYKLSDANTNILIGWTTSYGSQATMKYLPGYSAFHINKLGINTDAPGYALDVSGVIHATTGIFSDGYVTAGAAQSSSDMRLKTNVRDIENALVVLKALKPREWDWNEYSAVKGHAVGFIAQEVEPWMPYAVGEIADAKLGTHKTLSYEMLHALTIAGWQNHESRLEKAERKIKEQDERIFALESENRELKARLNA